MQGEVMGDVWGIVTAGDEEALRKWIADNEAGLAASIKTSVNVTLLHIAARCGHVGIINILLEENAYIDALNNCKSSPLHWAAQYNQFAAVECLVGHGADTKLLDQDGYSALYLGVSNAAIVKSLLDNGADIHAQTKTKKTALDAAREGGYTESVALLEEAVSTIIEDSAGAGAGAGAGSGVGDEGAASFTVDDTEPGVAATIETAVHGTPGAEYPTQGDTLDVDTLGTNGTVEYHGE